MTEDKCRGIFHCRIEKNQVEVLCATRDPKGPSRPPSEFLKSPGTIGHWWIDGTHWKKCPKCESHPDFPLLILRDV